MELMKYIQAVFRRYASMSLLAMRGRGGKLWLDVRE
jgi:hypothetical protein